MSEISEQAILDLKDAVSGYDCTVLDDAKALVTGPRNEDYGHPIEMCERIAQAWTAVLGRPVSAKEFTLCMGAMKIVREAIKPKRDNRVDAAGYAAISDMVSEGELKGKHHEGVVIDDTAKVPFEHVPDLGITLHGDEPVGFHTSADELKAQAMEIESLRMSTGG